MKQSIFLFILFFHLHAVAQTFKGKVVKISDGDSITVLDSLNRQIKVRLFGIDCPEKNQDFGTAAKKFTSSKCFAKTITVHSKGLDRYKRVLGIVVLQDNSELNLLLIQAGLAWEYKYAHTQKYFDAEQAAHAKKIGLWSMANPVAPWDFRKSKKAAK